MRIFFRVKCPIHEKISQQINTSLCNATRSCQFVRSINNILEL